MELQKINKLSVEEKAEKNRTFVEELKKMPIAIQQDKGSTTAISTEKLLFVNSWYMLFLSSKLHIYQSLQDE
jgi:hypothetical protein